MATTPIQPGALSVDDLMTRGYFPDRIIPPVNSLGLSIAIPDMISYLTPIAAKLIAKKAGKLRSRCVIHSVPKRKHMRRSLAIPNPLHQCLISGQIAFSWQTLQNFCAQSPFSLSVPVLSPNRAISPRDDLSKQPWFRAQRSVGARYLLKTDIARFYPSIYTHSIPWALHGKSAARADGKYVLEGNRIDLWIRETQDKQTGGIPIGPDTSFIVGELIGTALDLELQKRMPNIRGTRSIDDYYLYFDTVAEAETGLAVLHEIARLFELEINDPKTEVLQMPDTLEPAWKSDLRGLDIRPSGQPQITDLLSLFDKAFELSKHYPADSILTYAAKQVLSSHIAEDNWKFCEALLLKAALSEPTMLSVLIDVYERYPSYHQNSDALTSALQGICSYHAPLQQGNEVSWALWLAKKMNVTISKAVGDKIAMLDDDIVALIALDLQDLQLLETTETNLWKSHMNGGSLYEDHWLLAYEGHEHGWLGSGTRPDYVLNDPFFSILQTHGVRFYGDNLVATASYYGYSGDDLDDESEVQIDGTDLLAHRLLTPGS